MMQRLLKWVVQKLGVRPLIGFSLLTLAVGSAAFAFTDAIRQISFEMIFPILILSLFFSWLAAQSQLRGWSASILLVVTGMILVFIRVGELTAPLIALVRVTFSTIWQILNLSPGNLADFSTLSLAFSEVYFGAVNLIAALTDWIQALQDGLPLINDLAISLLWSYAIWLLTSWAGWWFRRLEKPLIALLPVGIFSVAIMGYTWSDTFILGPMVFAVLLLFAYVNFDQNERRWKSTKIDYPEDLPNEFSGISVAIVFGIVLFALILPFFPLQGIINFVSDFTAPQIEQVEPVIESFGLEQSTIPRGDIGKALRGGLPRFHLIGSGPELSEQIVMTVKISGGVPSEEDTSLALPLYWRSLTYNEYFGFGWRSSDIVIRTYDPGEEVISTESPYHQVIQQDIRLAQGSTNFLYAAGEVVSADDVFKIAYRPTPRYTEILNAHGDFFGASIDQNAFRVQSLIPVVSEEILRESPNEYPGWVMERYLSLPDTIPMRVLDLAQEITAEDRMTYDKVRSLETYLRGFEYTLDVDLPPVRSDLVDYFLFDLQKGYCDYYASSMVVMARSLGIPARISVGYVRGAYDPVNNRYIVSEAEAHSWVEIYFVGIGWIPFEPTAGRDPITRFESEEQVEQSLKQERDLDDLIPWGERLGLDWNWIQILFTAGSVSLLLLLGIFTIDRIRLQNLTPEAAANLLYQRLYRHARSLGVRTTKECTPFEFSERLVKSLLSLTSGSWFDNNQMKAAEQVKAFTQTYTLMRYSPKVLTMEDRNKIIHLWQSLRNRLTFAGLIQFFRHQRSRLGSVASNPYQNESKKKHGSKSFKINSVKKSSDKEELPDISTSTEVIVRSKTTDHKNGNRLP